MGVLCSGVRCDGVGCGGLAQRCTHGAFYSLQGDPGIMGPPGAKVRPLSQAQEVAWVGWAPRLRPEPLLGCVPVGPLGEPAWGHPGSQAQRHSAVPYFVLVPDYSLEFRTYLPPGYP